MADEENEVEVVATTTHGPNYTYTKDLCLCKAFIRASKDSVAGVNQRTNQFKAKFFEEFKKLVIEVNNRCGTS
jgi:hypothetical protein